MMENCPVCGEPVNRYRAYVEESDERGWQRAVYHADCVTIVRKEKSNA